MKLSDDFSYEELLQRLSIDLPGMMPGVVQSSIGGSSGSVAQPAQGSRLVWDAGQQLYVPLPATNTPWQPFELTGAASSGNPGAAWAVVTPGWGVHVANSAYSFNASGGFITVPAAGSYLVWADLGLQYNGAASNAALAIGIHAGSSAAPPDKGIASCAVPPSFPGGSFYTLVATATVMANLTAGENLYVMVDAMTNTEFSYVGNTNHFGVVQVA